MESYRDSINYILGKQDADWLFSTDFIRYEPLAYMRGRTFHDSMMILDEAQNADFRQLMLFISRMGKNSKVVVSGDVSQYDIERNKVALPNFVKMLEGINGVGSFELSDEEREIMNTFVRSNVMSKEEYIAELKRVSIS